MLLEIITPDKIFLKEDVDLIRVPGSLGSFAMKKNHTPIISTLDPGVIKIVKDHDERFFEIFEQSFVEQHDNKITLLVTRIEETFPILVR